MRPESPYGINDQRWLGTRNEATVPGTCTHLASVDLEHKAASDNVVQCLCPYWDIEGLLPVEHACW